MTFTVIFDEKVAREAKLNVRLVYNLPSLILRQLV